MSTRPDSPRNPYRARLVRFYQKYNREKLGNVDKNLKMFKGQEEEMFVALVEKYGPEPTQEENVGPVVTVGEFRGRRKSKMQGVPYDPQSGSTTPRDTTTPAATTAPRAASKEKPSFSSVSERSERETPGAVHLAAATSNHSFSAADGSSSPAGPTRNSSLNASFRQARSRARSRTYSDKLTNEGSDGKSETNSNFSGTGGNNNKRSRSKTEAVVKKSGLPPPLVEGEVLEKDLEVKTKFHVRYNNKYSVLPGQPVSHWKPHEVDLLVPVEGEAVIKMKKISKKTYQIGKATDGVKEDFEDRTKTFPLAQLEMVDRGKINEKESVMFQVEEDDGTVVNEFRYGSLLLTLNFALENEYLKLEMCCDSTDERDVWYKWFTDFIVNCELQEIREEQPRDASRGRSPSVPRAPAVESPTRESSAAEAAGTSSSLDSVIEKPKAEAGGADPVHTFICRFLTNNSSSAAASDPADSDPKVLPDKGKVLQTIGASQVKRKLVCPEQGWLVIKDGLGLLTKDEIDLEEALIQVESPWQPHFTIKLLGSQAKEEGRKDDTLYFKCSSDEARAKMVEWLITMRGIPQSNKETFKTEGDDGDDYRSSERQSQQTGKDTDGSFAGDESITEEPNSPLLQSQKSESERQQRAMPDEDDDEEEELDEDEARWKREKKRKDAKRAKEQRKQEALDEAMKAILAYPVDVALENDDRNLAEGPLKGEWCRVQYHRLGERPTSRSAFLKRFVTIDPVKKRLTIVAKEGLMADTPPLVDLDLATDLKGITTTSKRFGLLAISFHVKTQPIVLHIVPANAKAKIEWTELLTGDYYKVNWLKESFTEDIEELSFTRKVCYLCGKESSKTPICRATMLQHREFLETIKDPKDIKSIFASLPPRSVKPVALLEALEKTEKLLEKAKQHRERAQMALAVDS